jgi:hypothetical protein
VSVHAGSRALLRQPTGRFLAPGQTGRLTAQIDLPIGGKGTVGGTVLLYCTVLCATVQLNKTGPGFFIGLANQVRSSWL